MLGLRFDCSGVLVVVGLGVLSLQGSVRAQIAVHQEFDRGSGMVRGDGVSDEVTAPEVAGTVIVGRVIGSDGVPAVGAVVVSSAGGQAVTDEEGAFSLEVELPVGSESVRVTAVLSSGTGSLIASSQVGGLALWGTTSAGMLVLEQAAGCQPSWSALGSGMNSYVNALTVGDDGSGPALYAGGGFTAAGSVVVNFIAKWNGTSWSALGSGMNTVVYAVAAFDDGSSPALYAGGLFTTAGGVVATGIAKWNGSIWSALGSGLGGGPIIGVYSLAVFDDGSGSALYVGGAFTTAGGVVANFIAKWNGMDWSAVGGGVSARVDALTVFDDGSGPALYAGGTFISAGGVPAKRIAKWNGSTWSKLGGGISGGATIQVLALTVYDDGSGPALYAGGQFTTAGGVAANSIAKWNGTNWSALGSGVTTGDLVSALTVFDDGSGPALYAGGGFTTAGGVVANGIAKWDGSNWSGLGTGVSGTNPWVQALTVFDDGSGPALYAGGFFSTSPAGDSHLAKWSGCSTWTDLGSGLPGVSGIPQLTGFGELLAGTAGAIHLASAAPSALALLFVSTSSTPTPFKGGTLLTVPVLLTLPLATDPLGEILFPWTAWPSGLSGVSLFLQYAIQDAVAVKGVALSNALGADVP